MSTDLDGSPGPDVRLELPARSENVALVRQALAGVLDALGVAPPLAADLKIALTEACTNAVKHGYDEEAGALEVTMSAGQDFLSLSVRDRGPGFKPLTGEVDAVPFGFGLALIASLADAFAIQGGAAGSEVQMTFDLAESQEHPVAPAGASQLRDRRPAPPADRMRVRVRPGPLVAPVLGRVISLLAARASFSIDRLSDAQLVSDAIAAHSSAHALDGHVSLAMEEGERLLELRIGPLVPGGGEQLVRDSELPGLGRLLEQLTDEVATEPVVEDSAVGELLLVRLAQSV